MTKVVKMIAQTQRTPILRRPDEYGMDYEDVSFSAADGIVLEGWYIPAKEKSDKVVICNHFSPGNRYGYAGHIKPWHKAGGFEVNFLPKYKALHKAGYNILAYDLRNHGFSAPAQNGAYNPNFFEYKDVIGSLNYVRSREETKEMEIHLHSMCLGGNATLVAMRKQPEVFEGVKSMMLIQPISGDALVRRLCKNMRMTKRGYKVFEEKYREIWGFSISDSSPILDAPFVNVPTFVAQVKDDSFTYSDDVYRIFEAISATEKELFWIGGTTQRFHGYTYFSENPEQMLAWYQKHSG
ncbi:S9 family peptidase [Photobacterium sp. OFAV2-7]|uniref:alpha/beta hydrolase family protein n=1 Tax=Photobacterium sp. OFAV2-7 TaxID=2917748 RepID=UPI001EF6C5B0|nr:alpha/beta hydrolase [Photobacterium sp. OFAV2-7]MCG7587234.1 alpha/beta hydrolase [Photobacterium sp. OFAV2-7]